MSDPFPVTLHEYRAIRAEYRALKAERDQLREIGKRLLREYEAEEAAHGFPFNFALRDAHRDLKRALGPVAPSPRSDAAEGGERGR